jgi:hypothetical protein
VSSQEVDIGYLSLSLSWLGVLIVPPPGLPPGVLRGVIAEGSAFQ